MKISKYILMTLVGSAMALATASCGDKFLDELPDNRVELKTVEHLRMLLNDSYPEYNYMNVCEMSSDNVIDNNSPDSNGNRFFMSAFDMGDDELFAFEDVQNASGMDSPGGVWEGYYKSIASANSVLEKIEEFEANGYDGEDASLLPGLKAEAMMLRAYCHWTLAEVFCEQYRGPELSKDVLGLPYMTKPETKVKPSYQRGNLAEFYDNIEKDLLEALPNIDNSIYEIPKYHFNSQAAHAFAARFYLHKRDYKKVLEHCDKVFGEDADVSSMMSEIWSKSSDFYYLTDFGLYQQSMTLPRNFLLISTYSMADRHFQAGRYALSRDAKRAAWQGPGPTWQDWSWRLTTGTSKESWCMHPFARYVFSLGTGGRYGILVPLSTAEQFEFSDKHAQIGYPHITISEFNAEETLFMRAEAKIYLGMKASAIEDLKIWELSLRNYPGVTEKDLKRFRDLTEDLIRSFYAESDPGFGIVKPLHIDEVYPCEYSVSDDIEPILQCLLHFRRYQTVQSGLRFFDLKRYGIEYSHVIGRDSRVETLTTFDKRRAIQIPYEAVEGGMQPTQRGEDLRMDNPDNYVVVSSN